MDESFPDRHSRKLVLLTSTVRRGVGPRSVQICHGRCSLLLRETKVSGHCLMQRRPNQSTFHGRRKTGGGYSRVRRTSDRKSSHPPFIRLLEGVGLSSARRPYGTCPPCFDEASLICKNNRAFVRAKSVVRGPYSGQRGSPQRHSASTESEQGLTLNGTPFYHPTVFHQTGVI
jgi:hypothetical protein